MSGLARLECFATEAHSRGTSLVRTGSPAWARTGQRRRVLAVKGVGLAGHALRLARIDDGERIFALARRDMIRGVLRRDEQRIRMDNAFFAYNLGV